MKISSLQILCIVIFFNTHVATSQSAIKKEEFKTFQEYEQIIRTHKQDTLIAIRYAKEWLGSAKMQNNADQQFKAYQNIMHLVEKKFRMIYADSLLDTALATNNNALIGSAHLTIGAAHYNNRALNKALDHYLVANEYISKTKDAYLIHKLKYTLAQTKYHLGYYEEASILFSECLKFFKGSNSTAYIKSLHALGLCYTHIGRYDLCTFNNQLGMESAAQLNILEMIPYFKNSEGINQYKLKNEIEAIHLLLESLPIMEQNKDVTNQIVTWFYLGKSYWDTNEKQQAIAYLNKVKEEIDNNNLVHPDIRGTYEILLDYHVINEDLEQQLLIIEKLLAYDRHLHENYKYLSYKIHKEYDTKSLRQQKQKIQQDLVKNKIQSISIIVFLALCILGALIYHFYNKKIHKQRFDQIMKELLSKKKVETKFVNPIENISPEVTKAVLKNLDKFEANNKFTEKDINLTKLATLLNTNTKYASLIITHHRGKKTTTYINDLKIEFVLNLLIHNNKFRNYTNRALAEEAGFGSTQIFTQCFKTKIGMSPTAFIQQLKSIKENTLL